MLNLTPREEVKLGSDFTGTTGQTSRTYTLAYSNIYATGMEVRVSGSFLTPGTQWSRSGQVITILTNLFDAQDVNIAYYTYDTSAVSGDAKYATTLQLARFMQIEGTIPDRNIIGASRDIELLGVGDNSETVFWLDKAFTIAGTYTISYGASTSSVTALTDTTHYDIDKNLGKVTLTSAGVTAVGTNNLYGAYSYCKEGITDTQLSEALVRAEQDIDTFTNNHFAESSHATPDWDQYLNEEQDGLGVYQRNYFSLNHYPMPDVSTNVNGAITAADATITVDSTNGFPSSGSILIEDDKILYTGKSATTFTGCTSVAAHVDDVAVKPYVVEISTTSSGGTISWDILKEGTEFELDRKTGRVHVYAAGASYDGTYVDVESSPIKGVANRFRMSYITGYSSIPADIVQANLMLAARDIMAMTVRKSHTAGMNKFNPSSLDVDKAAIDKKLSAYRNEMYSNC